MSNLHPLFETILKPHLQGQKVANRARFRVLSEIHAELEAAGVVIDIGQIDWAVREFNDRMYEASLDRQFEEKEAEREERRQYREWRNDSGV